MYTGPTCWPLDFASRQSIYGPDGSELSTTSLLVVVFQQTCEPAGWVASIGATRTLGKVPLCFSVIRTHLYFSEADVPVKGATLATVVTAADGGGWALPLQGTPVGPPALDIRVNVSWQNP